MTDPATEPVDRPGGTAEADDLEDSDEPADLEDSDELDDLEHVLAAAPGIGAELEVDPGSHADVVEKADDDLDAVPSAERDYLGDLQRVTAEFANFRKQTDKRNHDLLARASQRLVEALLPVLDAFDAAAIQGVDGVEPIHAQLLAVLGNEGLEVIAEVGESFDPNRHEAVMTEQAEEGDEGTIVAEILRTGYAWKGRVFRPAMVKARG